MRDFLRCHRPPPGPAEGRPDDKLRRAIQKQASVRSILLDAPPSRGMTVEGRSALSIVIAREGGRSSQRNGTLYIGVTNDIVRWVYEHRSKVVPGFTKRYGVMNLVYYEIYDDIENAIRREKRLKKWDRAWKLRLIEEKNPDWIDLYPSIAGA